jgi:hypothetical protein
LIWHPRHVNRGFRARENSVRPLSPAGERPDVLSGSPQEIAGAFRSFESAGYTRLEVMFGPGTMTALEGLVRVLEAFDGRDYRGR